MAAKLVLSWRGRIRGQLRQVETRISALLNYNSKHPTLDFLSSSDAVTLTTAQAIVSAKLTDTKPR